ncbi:heterokaryon incompatibility protein [Neofusicoccum parvum]|uniref:Heterokaryon incompatibility protein n=1 Tax=Neofusicoccum parvum TaxID=310453 RepID=A0ACB5SJF5_9PEZI|nr:heterokaryon incompatibility protein [Neofusicoccum parvum]
MIHASVDDLQYEAVSYAWGDSTRVAELPIAEAQGHIALTKSLVKALPYLARASQTGLLWIDQICIHQADLQEREQQVALMGDVFRNSTKTLIWLDLDDDSGWVASDCLSAIRSYKTKDHPERSLEIKALTNRPDWKFATQEFTDTVLALRNCSWMSRAWVVQEYILS